MDQVPGRALLGGVVPWAAGGLRNGLPDVGGYRHPGWAGGVPSEADNPVSHNTCRGCGRHPTSREHRAECLGQDVDDLCGTLGGYRRHVRLRQGKCGPCKAAKARHKRLERAARDPSKCQECGYLLGGPACAGECGPGGGVPLFAPAAGILAPRDGHQPWSAALAHARVNYLSRWLRPVGGTVEVSVISQGYPVRPARRVGRVGGLGGTPRKVRGPDTSLLWRLAQAG